MIMMPWYFCALVLLCFRLLAMVKAHARLMSPPSRSSMWRQGFPTKTNFNDNGLYCGGFNIAIPKYTRIILFIIIPLCGIRTVCCHARMMEPPSRSSMWRNGYDTPTNYDDDGLYCGGFQVQWQRNGGKCGICGDPYDMPHPRDNEAGGKYGRGIISKTYISGQLIEAIVDVTTNHKGYFEFKICPNNNVKTEATQECLDKHVLKLATGGTRYYITDDQRNGDFAVMLRLPKGLTCSQCVFQWTYVAGNNWGMCNDGDSRLGCGPQETFRGCADVAILKNPGSFTPYPSQNDIGYKFETKTLHKQELLKETFVKNFPKYTAEISSQILTDKSTVTSQDNVVNNKSRKRKRPFSTWMATELTADINQRTSLTYNTTNYKWNTSKRSTDSKNKIEYYPPTTHSYFDKMTAKKDDWSTSKSSMDNDNVNGHYVPTTETYSSDKKYNWIASKRLTNPENQNFYLPTTNSYPSTNPSVLVLERESELNKMLQQLEGEIQLLRFYLQEDRGKSSYADTVRPSTYMDTVGRSTYMDTVGPSTTDGVNKIIKDYWYL